MRWHRNIHHILSFGIQPTIWIQRGLEKTTHQYCRIILKSYFATIAMMHIKINKRNALKSIVGQSIFGSNSNIIKQTKPHRPIRLSVVPWRPYRTKNIIDSPGHHGINRCNPRTRSAKSSLPSCRIHRRVAINLKITRSRGTFFNKVNMSLGMY